MNLSYVISSAFHASRKCGTMRSPNTPGSARRPGERRRGFGRRVGVGGGGVRLAVQGLGARGEGSTLCPRRAAPGKGPRPPPPRRSLLHFVRGLYLGQEVFARRLIVMLPF